jgi:hypothetical protein
MQMPLLTPAGDMQAKTWLTSSHGAALTCTVHACSSGGFSGGQVVGSRGAATAAAGCSQAAGRGSSGQRAHCAQVRMLCLRGQP